VPTSWGRSARKGREGRFLGEPTIKTDGAIRRAPINQERLFLKEDRGYLLSLQGGKKRICASERENEGPSKSPVPTRQNEGGKERVPCTRRERAFLQRKEEMDTRRGHCTGGEKGGHESERKPIMLKLTNYGKGMSTPARDKTVGHGNGCPNTDMMVMAGVSRGKRGKSQPHRP